MARESVFSVPTSSSLGEKQNDIKLALADTKKNHQLLDSFVMVPAVALKMTTVLVSLQSGASSPKEGQLSGAFLKEKSWLDHAIQVLLKNEIEKGDTVAWSAFHTSMLDVSADLPSTLTQLLPLFYEEAATAAMIKHCYVWLQNSSILDCAPLYALAKFTQWKWPDTHGEEKFIVMFT